MEAKRNYQNELEQIIRTNRESDKMPKLLLHSCCAPCSSYVLEYLSQHFSITVFYYNPNIYPDLEYSKRVKEQQEFIKQMEFANKVEFIEGDFDKDKFYETVKGSEECKEGQERCFRCYELRIAKAAKVAKEEKADYFTTTLSISPLKNADKINEIGEKIAAEEAVEWLPADFKKKNGYNRSIELSKEYGIYRQNYCGCVYST